MKKIKYAIAIASLGMAVSGFAQPINPVFTAPPGQPAYSPTGANQPVNLGEEFTPSANVIVDALGFYALPGLSAGETVGIYNSIGGLVTSAPVGLLNQVGSYYWQIIAPVTLTGGSEYTVDVFTGNNPWIGGFAINTAPGFAFNGSTYVYGSSLQDPTAPSSEDYYGPNLSTVPVPDGASTAMLCGMSLAAVGWLRRRLS